MSSTPQSAASESAYRSYSDLARQYYGVALPGLDARNSAIETARATGEPGFLKSAFAAQRTGLAEGMTGRGDAALAAQTRGAAGATRGGNFFASLHPAQIGAQLANALYGSRFQEGQASIDQSLNLMSMGLGGAGTAGSGALTAAGSQLQSIGYLPNYNKTLAMASGIGSLAGAGYGAFSQGQAQPSSWQGSTWNPSGTVNLTSFGAS